MKDTSGFFKGVDIHDQNKLVKPKIIKKVIVLVLYKVTANVSW